MTKVLTQNYKNQNPSERVASLDVLRGYAMFWIIGADQFVRGFRNVSDSSVARFFYHQLQHASWEGFTFYDHIFPLFIFVMGASLVFSFDKILAGENRKIAITRIVRRFVLLFVLGMIADGGVNTMSEENIFMGVLQRIAWCYLITAILYLTCGIRALLSICVVTLVFYWVVLTFVPLPGTLEISFEIHKNWPNYIDNYLINQFLLPGEVSRVRYDPEGVLSTIPATVNCLFGVFAGLLLKSSILDRKKVYVFVLTGIVMLLLGYLWGMQFPINKRLWTSSYVLVGGGWSFILIGVFYLALDIYKWRRWFLMFIWIGANPLAIYMAVHLVDFNNISARILGGSVSSALGVYSDLINSAAVVSLAVLVCYILYRRGIFMRV